MAETIDHRNIVTLHEVIKQQRDQINELRDQLRATNANVAAIQADVQNTKQMIAVLKGIGMGSTVHV